MFVLDAEEGPKASSAYFEDRDTKRRHGRMLELERYDGVEHPVKAQDWIDNHGRIIPPDLLVSQLLPQESMLCMWVSKTPVVVDIPEASVYRVDRCEHDDDGLCRRLLVQAIDAQTRVEHDGGEVLSTIEEMWELVASIPVASNTLQRTPDAGQCGYESQHAQVTRITLRRVVPATSVQAEEQGNILCELALADTQRLIYLPPYCT